MSFGQIIAEARKNLGLSQKELALRIKKDDGEPISPQYLNDIERDRRNPPGEYLVAQFSKELKIPKDYLLLAAGTLPEEFRQRLSSSAPETVEKAFQAFRRQLK